MQPVEQQAVRKAFVNSSRSKAASASFPLVWPPSDPGEKDFLGWVDPKAPLRGYVVVGPDAADELVAVELRLPTGGRTGRATLCDWCQTTDAPDGARLVVAPRSGPRGRAGDTVGVYVCSDFDCSARARQPLKEHQQSVSGAPDLRVPELVERVLTFVERVRER